MIRRIFSIVAKDIATGSRDQLITYVVLAPLLLGLLTSMVMPLLGESGSGVGFAVTEGLDPALYETLEHQGEVEYLPGPRRWSSACYGGTT